MSLNTNSIRFKGATTLTIATGAVTATGGYHIIASESGSADDLDTITLGYSDVSVNGTSYLPMLILRADAGDTITLKDGTGNIELSGGVDFALSGDTMVLLFWTGAKWVTLGGGS